MDDVTALIGTMFANRGRPESQLDGDRVACRLIEEGGIIGKRKGDKRPLLAFVTASTSRFSPIVPICVEDNGNFGAHCPVD